MFELLLTYTHIISLALWFCGLFGYIVIVWPSLERVEGGFSRQHMVAIGNATAPWIYLAMVGVLATYVLLLFFVEVSASLAAIYGLALVILVGNNVYGSTVSWPRIMLFPTAQAKQTWFWFKVRMTASLGLGLLCLSVAIAGVIWRGL